MSAVLFFFGAAGAAQMSLFSEAAGAGGPVMQLKRAETRARRVSVDTAAISSRARPNGADDITLNLFSDVSVQAKKSGFDRRDDQHVTWYGKVSDDPLSMVVLVAGDGLVAGSIFAHGKHYTIRSGDAGSQVVAEIDQSAFPRERCDTIPATSGAAPASQATLSDVAADSGAAIDVLVVYTPAARAAQGGTTAMNNLITLAVAETNATYANSGVSPRLNLAHAEEISYTESGNWDTDLTLLQGQGDGVMDSVHALRSHYAADVVVLLITDPMYCGLASAIMADASTAFALVAYDCATGNYSFGHEIGHLQGARHDWYVDPTNNSPYSFNHGDIDLSSRQRTIMSYNDQCLDTPPYTSCTRVPYWSNPGVNYPSTSSPAGSSIEDNHQVLNLTAATVANFRPKETLTVQAVDLGVGSSLAGASVSVTPTDTADLGTGSTPFQRTYGRNLGVTLTASATAGGRPFFSWTGCDGVSGPSGTVCSVTMSSTRTVTASYGGRVLTVASTYPAVGVSIGVSPADVNGLGGGSTSFTRTYGSGATVTLTAPATADGNPFSAWAGCTTAVGTTCTVTMDGNTTVSANYTRTAPTSFALWTRADTGRAAIWEVDPATGVLQNSVWLSSAGVGAQWTATSLARIDSATAYVLWTNSDTGKALLWTVNPTTGVLNHWAYLGTASGVGAGWKASSYTYVDASKGYVLWSHQATGKAILWTVDPSAESAAPNQTIPLTSWAFVGSSTGVGAGWEATRYTGAGPSLGYVLWTNRTAGKALLWTVDPSAPAGAPPTLTYSSWAFLGSPSGVGANWRATGYEQVGPTTGYVLWTNSVTGQAVLWTVNPTLAGGSPPTIASGSSFVIGSTAGASWFASSYVPVNAAPTLDSIGGLVIAEGSAPTPVALTGISAGLGESQPLTVTATSSNAALIPDPVVTYASPGATGSLSIAPVPYANGSATITVWVSDGQLANNPVSRTFTVTVTPVNDPPTDISLSPGIVDGGLPAGTTVGTLSTTDPDTGDTFAYAVVSEPGTDYTSFTTDGSLLKTAGVLDYAGRTSYSVRVRTTDAGGTGYSFEKTFTIYPPAYALWTRDSGQAILWTLHPASGAVLSSAWLGSPGGVGSTWQATSYARVDGTKGYVLWTKESTGQAILWTVDPSAASGSPASIPAGPWAFVGAAAGVGAGWKATSYLPVDGSTANVLWTKVTTGQAILWTVPVTASGSPPAVLPSSMAFLGPVGGVGAGWQASSVELVDTATRNVVWTKRATGQAILWTVTPGAASGSPPTVAASSSAFIGAPAGVAAGWQASSYALIDASTANALWTNDAAGQAILWTVPTAASGTPPGVSPTATTFLGPAAGVGARWQASSYAR